MTAVLGGLGAAIVWSVGATFSSRAARAIGPLLTLAWVMLIGLAVLAVLLPLSGSARLSGTALGWLLLGGLGNVGGLLLMYRALRIGQLGVVMPIVTTEGGIAALIAIITGQAVGALGAIAMLAIVLGVIMTASGSPIREQAVAAVPPPLGGTSAAIPDPLGHGDRQAALWATIGALSFGLSLFATGRAGRLLPTAWAVLPPRVIGVVAVALPLMARRQFRWVSGTIGWLLAAGLCEVGGFFAYTTGAHDDIAVAAVLSTLTGAISAGFGRLLFAERLRPLQLTGVAVIAAGVAALTVLSA